MFYYILNIVTTRLTTIIKAYRKLLLIFSSGLHTPQEQLTGGNTRLILMETFRKLFTGITIWYPSGIFIGDNNKRQLTMLSKYNYGGFKAQRLTQVKRSAF
jgi:hypothetical protein